MKAKILFNEPGGRFHAGEIGKITDTSVQHDLGKYAYVVRLQGTFTIDDSFWRDRFIGGPTVVRREFYFFKDEVQIIEERNDDIQGQN